MEHPAESTPIGRNAHSDTSDKCNKSLHQNAGVPRTVFQCRNCRILLNSNVPVRSVPPVLEFPKMLYYKIVRSIVVAASLVAMVVVLNAACIVFAEEFPPPASSVPVLSP